MVCAAGAMSREQQCGLYALRRGTGTWLKRREDEEGEAQRMRTSEGVASVSDAPARLNSRAHDFFEMESGGQRRQEIQRCHVASLFGHRHTELSTNPDLDFILVFPPSESLPINLSANSRPYILEIKPSN